MKYSLYIWSFRILNETAILGFKMKTLFSTSVLKIKERHWNVIF